MWADIRFLETDRALLRAEVYVMDVDARYRQHKDEIKLISREQSRRAEELQRSMRDPEPPPNGGRFKIRGRT